MLHLECAMTAFQAIILEETFFVLIVNRKD